MKNISFSMVRCMAMYRTKTSVSGLLIIISYHWFLWRDLHVVRAEYRPLRDWLLGLTLPQDKIKYLSDPKASLKLHYWNI